MKEYKTLQMAVSIGNALAVLAFAGSTLFSMVYLSADMPGAAFGMFVSSLVLVVVWLVISGVIEVLIDIAQNSFVTASLLTQIAAKKKPKDNA